MTIKEIKERLKGIEELANRGDDEAAHGNLNSLYIDVLKHFAKVSPLARAALRGEEIEFGRWCA